MIPFGDEFVNLFDRWSHEHARICAKADSIDNCCELEAFILDFFIKFSSFFFDIHDIRSFFFLLHTLVVTADAMPVVTLLVIA